MRHLLLVGRAAEALVDRRIDLALGGQPAATIDPTWLQPPLSEGADLIDGLSDRGRRRLLKLFLTTGASLFGFGDSSEFSRAAGRLLDLLGVRALAPASWSPLGAAGRILSFRVAAAIDPARIGALVVLAGGSVARLPGCQPWLETREAERFLHVYAPRPAPAAASLIGLGETPVRLRTPAADAAALSLHAWLEHRDAATRRWVHALVEVEAGRDPAAAALLRELRHGGAAEPTLAVRHLSATPVGLLYALDVHDPGGLLRAVRIERGGAAAEIDLAVRARPGVGAGPLVGFAGLPRAAWFDEACRVRAVYHSGRLRTVHDGRPDAFAGGAPRGFASRATPEAADSLARARLSMSRPHPAACVEEIGVAPARPALSIVTAVGADLDLIRARAARLFAEPGAASAELVYHVPAGPQERAARAAIEAAATVYGLPHRMVTTAADCDASSALIAALGAARGEGALVLGADVLPAGPGWLAAWLRAIGPQRPIVGGTLLAVDGSVIDAGGAVAGGRRGAARRAPGMPGAGLPRSESAPTSRATIACVGLSRRGVELLLAATWHPEPDVLLAQAVAGLARSDLAARTLLRGRCVRFAEAAVRDPLTLAADARAVEMLLKRSFSLVGDEG